MRRLTQVLAFCSVSALAAALSACASQPRTLSEPHTASAMAPVRHSDMTVEEAQKILDKARVELLAPETKKPASIEDVMNVLRSDEIALFPSAVEFANGQATDKKAKTLGAQLEIAWGEDLRIVARVIELLDADLRDEQRELEDLEAMGKATAEDKSRLAALDKLLQEKEPLSSAMARLAPIHLAKGRAIAEELVKETPDSYEGYRVLADYYRIRGDWERFDAMVAEVEKRYPQSTGLLFLKGVALAERKGDNEGGSKLIAEALKADPKFARARVQLFFLAKGLTAKHDEFLKLKAESPRHQLVALAGPVIEEVYASREKRRNRVQRYDWRATMRDQ